MKMYAQNGFSVVEALLIIVVVGILGFTGYFVYHSKQITDKTLSTTGNSTLTQPKKQTANKILSTDSKNANSYTFVSYGNSGITLTSSSDVDKLTSASSALKVFFKNIVGKQVPDCGSGGCGSEGTVAAKLIINDVYGDYADGTVAPAPAASLWGRMADGSIAELQGTQNTLGCSTLRVKGVPAAFHIQCALDDGTVMQYNG